MKYTQAPSLSQELIKLILLRSYFRIIIISNKKNEVHASYPSLSQENLNRKIHSTANAQEHVKLAVLYVHLSAPSIITQPKKQGNTW